MPTQRYVKPYMWTFIAVGAAVVLYSAVNLPLRRLDLQLVPLAAFTLLVTSRFCITIPRTTGKVSFSDALLFIVMLLYGGEVAVILGAAESYVGSRSGRQPISVFTSTFNAAMMAVSTLMTVPIILLFFFTQRTFIQGVVITGIEK